jgi:hypothetical protein
VQPGRVAGSTRGDIDDVVDPVGPAPIGAIAHQRDGVERAVPRPAPWVPFGVIALTVDLDLLAALNRGHLVSLPHWEARVRGGCGTIGSL